MMENAAEVWKWIDQEGAHFFVCGDASRMAKDVDAALLKIVETEGGKNPEEAAHLRRRAQEDEALQARRVLIRKIYGVQLRSWRKVHGKDDFLSALVALTWTNFWFAHIDLD